ncbi:MAG: hypothetical protein ACKORJ_08175 [Bacteroidota bacterium]
MTKPAKKKSTSAAKPKVHDKLKGLSVTVDQFGELSGNVSIDQLNAFLDQHVTDKKVSPKKKRK